MSPNVRGISLNTVRRTCAGLASRVLKDSGIAKGGSSVAADKTQEKRKRKYNVFMIDCPIVAGDSGQHLLMKATKKAHVLQKRNTKHGNDYVFV